MNFKNVNMEANSSSSVPFGHFDEDSDAYTTFSLALSLLLFSNVSLPAWNAHIKDRYVHSRQ